MKPSSLRILRNLHDGIEAWCKKLCDPKEWTSESAPLFENVSPADIKQAVAALADEGLPAQAALLEKQWGNCSEWWYKLTRWSTRDGGVANTMDCGPCGPCGEPSAVFRRNPASSLEVLAFMGGLMGIQRNIRPFLDSVPQAKSCGADVAKKLPGTASQRRDSKASLPKGSSVNSIEVFCAYSHKDEGLRDKLENHLSPLKQEGLIRIWHDRRITAGKEWRGEIDEHLNSADVFLLLVSAYFLSSGYCSDVEVKRAMERHTARTARVIPVILRDADWQAAPFGGLQALPEDAKAVTAWRNQDKAFTDIAKGIRKAISELTTCQ